LENVFKFLRLLGPVAPTKLKFKYHLNREIIVN